MTESGAQKSSNENPSQTMTKKNAITLCIREGLKRRLGGVQQSQRQIAEEREEAPNVSFLAKKKEQIGDNESLENYLSTLPRLNPENRTLVWLLYNEEGEKEEVDEEELQSLPRRGTIEPRVISTPAFSTHGTEITSLSHCESARGTNGRGTPIPQDDSQPRLDELFKRFQEQQKRALKGHLKRCGNLTFIPASRRTHLNPLPQYMEITPDIIPFLATPPSRHKLDPIPLRENPQSSAAMKVKHTVTCHWLGCNHRFRNSNELYVHIEEDHLDSSHLDGEWVCQWRGCQDNIKLFSECYKLLLHIQMCHCKKSSRTIPHHRSLPSVDKPPVKLTHRLSYQGELDCAERNVLQPLPSTNHNLTGKTRSIRQPKMSCEPVQGTTQMENPPDLIADHVTKTNRPVAAKGTRRTRPSQ